MPGCAQVNTVLTNMGTDPPPGQVYIVAEVATPQGVAITQSVLEQVEASAPHDSFVRVDLLVQDGYQNIYANAPDRDALWTLSEHVTEIPSQDSAKVSPFYIMKDLCEQYPTQPIEAFFITEGTDRDETIRSMMAVAQQMAECDTLHISVLGVSPDKRAPFTMAFVPIADRTQFASHPDEISAVLESRF